MSARTFMTLPLRASSANITGNLTVGGDASIVGAVSADEVTAAQTVYAGTGLLANSGGVNVTAGGVNVTAGGVNVTAGDIVATSSQIRGGTVRSDGQLIVAAGGMSVEGNITQNSGNITSSAGYVQGLTLQGGDINVTGNVVLGNAPTDTVKFAGTAGSGLQVADTPVATDLATVITLANALRDAQKNFGQMA